VLAGIVALGFVAAGRGPGAAGAALFGAAVTMANGWLMHWRLSRAATTGSSRLSQFHMFFGVVERFALAIVGLAVGIGGLKLEPVAVIVGFAVTQAGYLIRGMTARS
jgi:ATP synthase protein I